MQGHPQILQHTKVSNFQKMCPNPRSTPNLLNSNQLLVRVLRIARVEILTQSTSAFHSVSDRRRFGLRSSSVFGGAWRESPPITPHTGSRTGLASQASIRLLEIPRCIYVL